MSLPERHRGREASRLPARRRGGAAGDTGPPPAPVDLRLVPAALLAWATAFHLVALPGRAALAVLGAALAVACLAGRQVWRGRHPRPGSRRERARHRALPVAPPAAMVLLAALAATASGVSATAQVHARTAGLLGELTEAGAVAEVTGRVIEEPRPLAARPWEDGDGRHRLLLQAREVAGRGVVATARAPVVVLGGAGWGELALGEEVRLRGVPRPTDPGEEAVALLAVAGDPEHLGPPPAHLRPVVHLRAALHEHVAHLGPAGRGLVPGVALGDDRRLPAELADAMRATSMTHIVAVSGTHTSIALGAVILALTGTGLPRSCRAAGALLALLAFVALVRPEPSVLRAAVMGAVVLAGLLLGRPARALPALAAAVTLLVVADPWLARSYGFALSVLGTAGLVLLARPWARWLSHLLPRWLATAVCVPAAAQAACGPLILLLEPAVPLYSVPANLLAAPALPGATLLGLLAAVLAPWPAAAQAAASLAAGFTWWIAGVAQAFAGLPGARLAWPGTLGGALALAAVTALAVAVLAWTGPPRAGPWVPACLIAAVLLLAPGPRELIRLPGGGPVAGWVAVQCDVGQGSAFLMRTGPGSAVMVDVGMPGSGAQRCLQEAGVERLDLLVLTHPHLDHVGGLPEVLEAVPVDEVLLSPATGPGTTVAAVTEQLAEAAVPGRVGVVGEDARPAGTAGAVSWEVRWPTAAAAERLAPLGGDAANDLSVVVLLEGPEFSVLALGDLELEGQAGLLRELDGTREPGGTRGPADVVVMAHHGSPRQDPALAAALAPRLTVVSVGENDYGHPAPEAVEMYAASGPVLRTDLCGAITVVATGTGLGTVTEEDC